MIAAAHAAAQKLTAAIGVPADIGDASGLQPPYLVLWLPPTGRPADEPAGGPCGSATVRLGLTCTGQDTEAAIVLADAAVQALTPGLAPANLVAADGRHAVIEFLEARSVQVDRDVTLAATNTHPAYVVVLFNVHSQPIAQEEP